MAFQAVKFYHLWIKWCRVLDDLCRSRSNSEKYTDPNYVVERVETVSPLKTGLLTPILSPTKKPPLFICSTVWDLTPQSHHWLGFSPHPESHSKAVLFNLLLKANTNEILEMVLRYQICNHLRLLLTIKCIELIYFEVTFFSFNSLLL